MARKPKAAPVPDDAPAPARRGRKQATAALPDLGATADGGNATELAAAVPDDAGKPIRARGRRGSKQPVDDAVTSPPLDHLQEQPEASVDQPETVQPPPMDGDELIPEADIRGADAEGSGASLGDVGPDRPSDGAAPPLPGLEGADRAKPAAHWDRATDAVRFDWSEIERTASQEGPNQAMAKLLVAARAEGANSRWPL